MKIITKILIGVLAICMLLSLFAACSKKGGTHQKPPANNQQNSSNQNSNSNEAEDWEDDEDDWDDEETVDPDANIEMPDIIDMGGYIYKAYVRQYAGGDELAEQLSYGNNLYKCIDFWIDKENSEEDIISFAVYSRNNRIESDYNCKIRQVSSNGNPVEHLSLAYTNGDTYDLTIISAKPGAQASTQNLLRNINAATYTDLTHPAFDQNSIKELSVQDKLFFISGDMNVSTLEVAGLSLTNMEFYADVVDSVVEAFGGDPMYSNIYNLVTSKKWTMETMMTIAELATIDVDDTDGDYSVIEKGDTIGYHQYLYSTLWYFYSSGGRITTKNEDGIPELTIQKPRNQELANYIYDHLNSVMSVPNVPNSYSAILDQNFLTGRTLFMDCSLFEIRTEIYPRAEFEYGILPCPLYRAGEDYHSLIFFNNWAHLWAIPNKVGNLEYAERMLQIMAVYSSLSDSTMHAYYNRTIYLNAAPDNGSRQVMNIIRQSLVYDIALMYDWGGLETMLNQLGTASSNPYANAANGVEGRVNPMIQTTLEQLRNAGVRS